MSGLTSSDVHLQRVIYKARVALVESDVILRTDPAALKTMDAITCHEWDLLEVMNQAQRQLREIERRKEFVKKETKKT